MTAARLIATTVEAGVAVTGAGGVRAFFAKTPPRLGGPGGPS